MNILIDIFGFANRGDQLMLESCFEQVRARLPSATIAIPESAWRSGASWCLKHGVLPCAGLATGLKANVRRFVRRFAEKTAIRDPLRLYPDQIDLILVAPGFRYGDAFKTLFPEPVVRTEIRKFLSFRKRGHRIVFLPQAFGSFSDNLLRDMTRTILSLASVVYARDETSRGHLEAAFPSLKNIQVVPDFTCLCLPERATVSFLRESYAVVVPNARMMDKTPAETAASYADWLIAVCRAIDDAGIPVVLLNHEDIGDEHLIHSINDRFGGRFTCLSGLSGMDCKHIIGHSKLVVSSRFHGAVSGLTQNVPTFCTSWSHKYEELLKEHGRPDNALDVADIQGSVAMIADALDHPESYTSARGCNDRIRRKVLDMWNVILGPTVPVAPEPKAQ